MNRLHGWAKTCVALCLLLSLLLATPTAIAGPIRWHLDPSEMGDPDEPPVGGLMQRYWDAVMRQIRTLSPQIPTSSSIRLNAPRARPQRALQRSVGR